jgi:hypothetical protein
MELKIGTIFTGSKNCFQGRIEVMEIDPDNNLLTVNLTAEFENTQGYHSWTENWDLEIVKFGLESGEYIITDFSDSDYPQDRQNRIIKNLKKLTYKADSYGGFVVLEEDQDGDDDVVVGFWSEEELLAAYPGAKHVSGIFDWYIYSKNVEAEIDEAEIEEYDFPISNVKKANEIGILNDLFENFSDEQKEYLMTFLKIFPMNK